MSYAYDQRKRPQSPQNTEPERTAAPGPSMDALMNGTARPAAARKGQSFGLDAAMQARMANTFGDLSAVRDYTHPAKTQESAQTGPYTGPVTHALSSAGPSPSAAGPMQAKRDGQAPQNMAQSVDIQGPAVPQFPSPNDIAALRRKKQGAPSADLIGPQISAADMNRLREIRPQNIMNEPPRPEHAAGSGSPKKQRSRTDKTADKLFQIGAGVLAGEEKDRIEYKKIFDEVKPVYYQQEINSGKNALEAEDIAENMAHLLAYKEGKKLKYADLSKKDKKLLDHASENANFELILNLHERRNQAARNLIAYRENLEKQFPGEDKDKLDFETSLSNEARSMAIYDRLFLELDEAPGMLEYHETMRQTERKEDQKLAEKAFKLSSQNIDKIEGSKYAKSEEGQARLQQNKEKNIEIFLDMYKNGGKKKKWAA